MFGSLPPLKSILAFESAARNLSFKLAAEELNVTPTAISHQVRQLEEMLRVTLFYRHTRSVSLTPHGEMLAERAYESLHLLLGGVQAISNPRSTLTISTTSSFASFCLVPRLNEFYDKHPDIAVSLQASEDLVDIERNHTVDLAIRYGVVKDADQATVLITEEFGVFGAPEVVDNACSGNLPLLLQTKWKNSQLPSLSWQRWLDTYDPNQRKAETLSYDQENHVIQAALAGQGLALVSSLLVKTALEKGWLRQYKAGQTLPGLSYYLVIPDRTRCLRKVSVFREWLIKG